MKRKISILFLLVYMSALTGWSADIHYCGNDISSISLFSKHIDKDCCCNRMKCDCCSDHKVLTKLHKAHKSQSKLTVDFKLKFEDLNTYSVKPNDWSTINDPAFKYSINHIPPLIDKTPVFVRNMVFRI